MKNKPNTPEDGWTYRWNDQPMTQDEYQRLTKEHLAWVEEQDRLQRTASTDRTSKRSKK
jgi:hypothetical protein